MTHTEFITILLSAPLFQATKKSHQRQCTQIHTLINLPKCTHRTLHITYLESSPNPSSTIYRKIIMNSQFSSRQHSNTCYSLPAIHSNRNENNSKSQSIFSSTFFRQSDHFVLSFLIILIIK